MKISYIKNTAKILLPTLFAFGLLLLVTSSAFAQDKQFYPLTGIPGMENMNKDSTIPQYINAIYYLAISLGAIFGVIKIAFAGVKYSFTEIVTQKGDALRDIQGVLLGLAILLVPFVVLNTIYPGLTNLDVLHRAIKIDISPKPVPATIQQPNTTQQQAVERYQNNPNNQPTTPEQWQFSGVNRDFCTGLAVQRNSTSVFTESSLRLGNCTLYPKI